MRRAVPEAEAFGQGRKTLVVGLILALAAQIGCATGRIADVASEGTNRTGSSEIQEPPSAGNLNPSASDAAGGTELTPTTEWPAPSAATPEAAGVPDGRDVIVTSITDGDTFRAGDERIRLTGVDTPEVSGGVECFGREATAALGRLIPVGSTVRLVGDVEATDRYGRTLSYVYRTSDGLFVNLALAREGYAQALTVPPNVAHAEAFVAAVAEARQGSRGLWSACEETTTSTTSAPPPSPVTTDVPVPFVPAPVPTNPPTTRAPVTGTCHASYPGVCIPPAPPDLDCGDIPFRRFQVLPPDPHRFDGDNDGIGCESG